MRVKCARDGYGEAQMEPEPLDVEKTTGLWKSLIHQLFLNRLSLHLSLLRVGLIPIFLSVGFGSICGVEGKDCKGLFPYWASSTSSIVSVSNRSEMSSPVVDSFLNPFVLANRHSSALFLISNLDALGAQIRVRQLGRHFLGRFVVGLKACGSC